MQASLLWPNSQADLKCVQMKIHENIKHEIPINNEQLWPNSNQSFYWINSFKWIKLNLLSQKILCKVQYVQYVIHESIQFIFGASSACRSHTYTPNICTWKEKNHLPIQTICYSHITLSLWTSLKLNHSPYAPVHRRRAGTPVWSGGGCRRATTKRSLSWQRL